MPLSATYTTLSLHKRARAFEERLMLGLESLFGKIKIAIFPQKKDGSGGGDSTFPTTARRTASAGESNDGNDGSSYQCPEPGCDEDFKNQADLDFHMN